MEIRGVSTLLDLSFPLSPPRSLGGEVRFLGCVAFLLGRLLGSRYARDFNRVTLLSFPPDLTRPRRTRR